MNESATNCRRSGLLSILVLFTGVAASGHARDFDPTEWKLHPFGWQQDSEAVRSTGSDAGTATMTVAPECGTVTVEADVKVERSTNDQWKVAAVAIVRDPRNYWHFGIVEGPDQAGRPNFCELAEMRAGTWNAQHDLKLLRHENPGGPWKHGQRYRLRVALTAEAVEGSIHDAAGRLIERKAFALPDTPAVNSGRPALRSPGFAARFSAISTSWDDPVPATAPSFPPYQSDSFVAGVQAPATGFFRVEQRDGKWWAFDPLGRACVPLGVDHVTYTGHWCEQLGYAPYHRKMLELFPNEDDWTRQTTDRLKQWGFNRIGGHAAPPLVHQGLNHSRFINVGTPMAAIGDACDITPNEGRPCSAFPNVFHPDFEAYCRYQAEISCRPSVGDPWLFGYFLDNELAWWGRGDHETGLFEAVMKKDPGHSAKTALRDFLAKRYENKITKLNQAWQTDLQSFADILRRDHLDGEAAETVRADKRAFLALVADRYFAGTTKAVRDIDPDHLILGCRFAGGLATPEVWAAAAKYCDVITLNYYGNVDLDRGIALDDNHSCRGEPLASPFARFAKLAGKRPLMVTEWSFISLDSGLPCTNGAGQRFHTQAQRARAAGIFAESLLRIPEVIGFDYFMWADEPALGITPAFPENSNYGLVNEDNEPYPELVASLSDVLHQAGRLHRQGPKPQATVPPPPAALTPGEFLALQPQAATPTAAALAFERDGDSFTIRNGRLSLSGALGEGPTLHSIRLGELDLGHYVTTAHQWVGRNEWPQANSVTAAEAARQDQILVVDLSTRFDAGPYQPLRRSYELALRLQLLPQTDWFLLELRSYRNLADRPAHLRGIYFQPYSRLGGSADGDRPATAGKVPRLWGRLHGDAWIDESAGTFLGVIAPRHTPLDADFHNNEQGGQHPDARWITERILQPDETLVPTEPIYWIITTGRGGNAGWKTAHDMPGLKQP